MAKKKKHNRPGRKKAAAPVTARAREDAAPAPSADTGSGSKLGIGATFAVAALLLGSAIYMAYHRNAPVQVQDQASAPVQAQAVQAQPQAPSQPQSGAQVAAPASAQPQPQDEAAAPNDPTLAPDFSLVNVANGKTVTLSKLRGKVVLVDFWATWCPPCRMTIPHLMDLQKEYGGKRFTVVGISVDQQGEAAVKPFYSAWKMNYPVVIDQDGSVARNYGGIRSIPTGLLIDRHGRVITGFVGYRPKEELEGIVKKALDSKS